MDTTVGERLLRSANEKSGIDIATADVPHWLTQRLRANPATVSKVPFDRLDGWRFDPETGNLGHRSGRFFTVEGLHVVRSTANWQQPIINQSEIGILGILAKEFDGVLHVLMQAKMEPGNPNLVQLSPTVQATRSNYTKAHGGSNVKYLEYFLNRDDRRVVADVLQSEHGAWFFHKRNRNMLIEVDGDVPRDEDFRWLTLGQLGELLHLDNLVNMDSRTVLASSPMAFPEPGSLSSDTELMSWFTGERARHDMYAERVPLCRVDQWHRTPDMISRSDDRFFRVVGVAVAGAGREVSSWSQPLFEQVGLGIVGFAYRTFDGVPHVLVHARVEGGFLDTAELGPTVQYVPANYEHLPPLHQPLFLDVIREADPARIRFASDLSEEGGRFLGAVSRYVIVETDESQIPRRPPPGYHWTTIGQLNGLAGHSRYLNVQARTLLAVLNTRAVDLHDPAG